MAREKERMKKKTEGKQGEERTWRDQKRERKEKKPGRGLIECRTCYLSTSCLVHGK